MTDETERIEAVLRSSGLSDRPWEFDSSIHSWRCEHPDRYGECSCFADLLSDIEQVVRERMAQAWAEGKHSEHDVRCRFGDGDCICQNPYRSPTGQTSAD